jgi:hypothetical protein
LYGSAAKASKKRKQKGKPQAMKSPNQPNEKRKVQLRLEKGNDGRAKLLLQNIEKLLVRAEE